MSSSSSILAADDDDRGGGSPIAAVHPDVIQSHILNRLDGASLAATSCASANFFSLCKDDHLWRDICAATWPSTTDPRVAGAISSFPAGHRSFYSDAVPALRHSLKAKPHDHHLPSELISAVDIHYDGELIHSRVLVTETASAWFLNTPFRLELLGPKETVPTPMETGGGRGACVARAEDRLRVSWILIDPARARAVDVASRKAVEARRHWLTDEIQLCYASVVAGGDGEPVSCAVVVTCGGEEEGGRVRVKEVSLQVEEREGRIMTGMESLRVLEDAMGGERRKSDLKREREMYERFLTMKVRCRERKMRRESGLDMVCTAAGICIFFSFWMFLLLST